MRRRLCLAGRDEHEAAAAARDQVRRERLRRVLHGADEERAQEVPVLERRLLDRRAAAPAADEVDEPVDAARVARRDPSAHVARRRRRRAGRRRRSRCAADLGRERVEARRSRPHDAERAPASASRRTTVGPEIPGAARRPRSRVRRASTPRRHASNGAALRSSVRAWQSRRSPSSRRSSASIWPTVTLRSIGDVERTVVVVALDQLRRPRSAHPRLSGVRGAVPLPRPEPPSRPEVARRST